jgi:hypothetical protein
MQHTTRLRQNRWYDNRIYSTPLLVHQFLDGGIGRRFFMPQKDTAGGSCTMNSAKAIAGGDRRDDNVRYQMRTFELEQSV